MTRLLQHIHCSTKKVISHIITVLGRISEQIKIINSVSQAYLSEFKIQNKNQLRLGENKIKFNPNGKLLPISIGQRIESVKDNLRRKLYVNQLTDMTAKVYKSILKTLIYNTYFLYLFQLNEPFYHSLLSTSKF